MLYRFKFNPLFKDTVHPKKDAMSSFPRRRESGVLVFSNLLERDCWTDGLDSRLCGNGDGGNFSF